MEIAREVEYQRRSKQLRRICREYNLTEGRISKKLLSSDILIDHQLNVCISIHKNNHNKIELFIKIIITKLKNLSVSYSCKKIGVLWRGVLWHAVDSPKKTDQQRLMQLVSQKIIVCLIFGRIYGATIWSRFYLTYKTRQNLKACEAAFSCAQPKILKSIRNEQS